MGIFLYGLISVNPEMAKNLAATLVSVQGTEFHGLVNFILNNKTLVSHDGRFAGIPPTLLAPTQFLGATMFALKVKWLLIFRF